MPHRYLLKSTVVPFLLCLFISSAAWAQSLPPIATNTNHTPAGTLKDGVLTVHLEIARVNGIRKLKMELAYLFTHSAKPDAPYRILAP